MAHSDICCGLYRGSVYLKEAGLENAALLPVGNAEFTITQAVTEITQPNFQSLGGTNCKVSYTESMALEMTLHCISPENMAIAFLGSASALTPTEVEGEEHAVNAVGELIAFNHAPDKLESIVVTDEGGSPTYVAGEDYIVTNAGIKILGGDIPVDGTVIEVNYTYGANYRLDAATMSQKEFYVVFDGVNVGESGEVPVVAKFYKVKFSPTDSFAFISGEEFASLAVVGEVLRDESKTTGSKFFDIEWGKSYSSSY